MDARTVAAIAEIDVGTVNVWVQRGLIAGMTIGARGRLRDFDLETATHISIMAQLVRLGCGAPCASWIAMPGRHYKRLVVAKKPAKSDAGRPPSAGGTQTIMHALLFHWEGFESDADLPNTLRKFPGGPPSVYIVINVEGLAEQMRLAQEEWEQRHEVKGER
jgi:hypothetical protein